MTKLTKEEQEKWWADVKSTITDTMKLKKAMQKRGLLRAKAKCPQCEGYLVAILVGPKQHIHMQCTGSCKRKMME